MKRKNQLNLLITACIIILTGLVSIQYYLVQNTYALTYQTYLNSIKKEILPIIESPEMDSIEDLFTEELKSLSLKRANDNISSEMFDSMVNKIALEGQKKSKAYLQSQAQDYPILNEIKLRAQIEQIIFETNNIYDTLLKTKDEPIVFMGENFSGKTINLNYGITQAIIEKEKDSLSQEINYAYKHFQSKDIDISNFQVKVWKKMIWILIAAISLLVFVILLFFWMYQSFIKQRKIADLKTDFANNISHELKTPVSSLALITKSLKVKEIAQDPVQLKELIEALDRQSNRIHKLTEKVLESSMEYSVELKKKDIITFIRRIISDFKTPNQKILIELSPIELYIQTDFYLLERVLQNVLENARKYSEGDSRIEIKSYVLNSEFIIEIQDNGIGIPDNELSKIFEKFHRIYEGNRHEIKGLGLGLYLSQKMMHSLGGTITVKSKLGVGSTFILKIPKI